jgi:hypothetical protein
VIAELNTLYGLVDEIKSATMTWPARNSEIAPDLSAFVE